MREKIQIITSNAPSPAGPYSQGIVFGDYVFVAGQRPQNPKTGEIKEGIQEQTKQVITNIQSILAEYGCTLADVVRSTVYLSDLKNFAPMNEVYSAMFSAPYPARTTVGVQLRGILVEIDVIAAIPKRDEDLVTTTPEGEQRFKGETEHA